MEDLGSLFGPATDDLDPDPDPSKVTPDAGDREPLQFHSPAIPGPLLIQQQRAKGIGFQLWPAATHLCRFLEHHLAAISHCVGKDPRDLQCLELGAGVGLVGIFAAALGIGHTTLTDLPDVLEALHINVTLNTPLLTSTVGQSRVAVRALAWGTSDSDRFTGIDLVLVADCVYWECLFAPLLHTLAALTATGAIVFMAHVRRWAHDRRFFTLAAKRLRVLLLEERIERGEEGRRQVQRLYALGKKDHPALHALATMFPPSPSRGAAPASVTPLPATDTAPPA